MAAQFALMAAPLVVNHLKGLGLSEIGASQALRGQIVTSAEDRARIAGLLNQLLSSGSAAGKANDVAVEELTMSHERIERVR